MFFVLSCFLLAIAAGAGVYVGWRLDTLANELQTQRALYKALNREVSQLMRSTLAVSADPLRFPGREVYLVDTSGGPVTITPAADPNVARGPDPADAGPEPVPERGPE